MVTIKDVAERARVSVGTVSNVLRGLIPVSPALRDRVLEAIRHLDYHPNQIARSLKTRQTFMLGMVISDITNPFFPQLTRGAEDAALEHNYVLVTFNTDDQLDREKRILSVLRTRRMDGVLLVVAPNHGDVAHIRNTIEAGIPIVCLDRIPRGLRLSSVSVDGVKSTEMCMRHLIALGHRKIAILTGSLGLETAADRLAGYRNGLREAGLPVERDLILEGDFRSASGYLLTKRLWLGGHRPTALFVSNGMMGIGALQAIRELGIRCPEDLALAMFDDLPLTEALCPPVTAIAQPAYEMGRRGAELLIAQIEGRVPGKPQRILLEAELKIRESTAGQRSVAGA